MKNSKPDSTNETGRRQQLPPDELENRLNPITNQLQKIVVEFERIQTQNAEFADKLKAALKEAEYDGRQYQIISMSSGSEEYCDEKIMTIEQMVKNLAKEFLRSHYDDSLKNIVFIFDKNRLSDNEIKGLGTFKNVMVEDKKAEPKKDFEVGKWYKLLATKSTVIRFNGSGGVGYDAFDIEFGTNIAMGEISRWQLATPKEVKEVLTKRCKELGLFDGEFECLSGLICIYKAGFIDYCEGDDKLWIGGNLAYEKGKFAKLIEKPKAKEQPKRYILRGITDAGFKRYNTIALHQLFAFINKELPQNFYIIPDAENLVLEEIPPAK